MHGFILGPVCEDPGRPPDGSQVSQTYEQVIKINQNVQIRTKFLLLNNVGLGRRSFI